MSKRFPSPDDDKEIMVIHGKVQHSLLDAKLGKCEDCNKMNAWFEEEVRKAGGKEKFLKNLLNEKYNLT